MKKILNSILVMIVATASFSPVFVFAQGRPDGAGNASGTSAAGANFCSALAQRFDNLESKAASELSNLQARKTDRENQLQERWDKYLANEVTRSSSTNARFEGDIQKLNDRVSSSTDTEKAAVSAFHIAVANALNARRVAVDAALYTFRNGVIAALKVRENSFVQAFTDRINGLKAAADKAKADCASGVSATTVRKNFVAAIKAAQDKFVSTKKADSDFGKTMQALTSAKKAAFDKAQSDFKAALGAAKTALKAALGVSNETTSTNQ